MNLTLIIAGGLVFLYFVSIYNRLVALKNNVIQSWGNIDLLLKQVHEEIPKLVEVCKQYMSYESELLEKITVLRTQAETDRSGSKLAELSQSEGELGVALTDLFARAEAYPDLKAESSFKQLSSRISTLQDSITDRREFYNEAVKINNTRRDQFPELLISRLFDFTSFELYHVQEHYKKDIDLKNLFSN